MFSLLSDYAINVLLRTDVTRGLCQEASFSLHECLLEQTSESDALVRISLHLVLTFLMPAHFDVFLQLFDLLVLHLAVQFDFLILSFKLLDEERFDVVRSLTYVTAVSSTVRCSIVCLLLKLPCQVFNVFFFLD